MTQQQNNPKRSVGMPVLIAILAIAAFAAAFYLLDGMSLVVDILDGDVVAQEPVFPATSEETSESTTTEQATQETPESRLVLPDGMAEEFALRIWQEQIDSQANILRLVSNEISRILITNVTQDGDEAVLDITAEFRDDTSAPGKLGMRKVGDNWYFAYVSGMREADTGGLADDIAPGEGNPPDSELPDIEDVDVAVLNTILKQQQDSAAVLEEYATGKIASVDVEEVVPGADTATLKIVMDEADETGMGEVVVISKEIDGETFWFIARFTKLAS